MKRLLLVVVGLLAVGWVALFLSGFGILVGSPGVESPFAPDEVSGCRYFSGVGFIEKGRGRLPECPRWYKIGGQ
jgi:hypothetical protein